MTNHTDVSQTTADGAGVQAARVSPNAFLEERSRFRRTVGWWSFRNISAAYVLVGLLCVFAFWIPGLFFTSSDVVTILYEQAVTALIGIGVVLPFSAGVFDASVGGTVGVGSILCAVLMVNLHVPWFPAVVLTVLAGAIVGVVNAIVIMGFGVDAIIATLGMLSVLTGLGSAIGNNQIVVGLPQTFSNLGLRDILGVALPVWVLVVVALMIWYVLDRTVTGRNIYATGGNTVAARLAGVRTNRIVFGTLVASGAVAGLAGVVATARNEAGQAAIGPPYLFPVFAAVFLGATQFRNGRFNVWGTLLATYTLAAGENGFILGGAPEWIPDVFNGGALIVAVALAVRRSRAATATSSTAPSRGRWTSRRFLLAGTAGHEEESPDEED